MQSITFFGLFWLIVNIFGVIGQAIVAIDADIVDDIFPDDFLFGSATSAYQIEGGWNADGKGPSIWDELVHENPKDIFDRSNGDVAADSYRLFEEDIKAVASMNMSIYRFSISWSRVLPRADVSTINEAGLAYYDRVINTCLKYGLEPMVTMFHYDLPLELKKFGGLMNSIFVNYFESYANLLFDRFGDRVKYWITINEPLPVCREGYGTAGEAPQINASGYGEYLCSANLVKAHASAYHLYQKRYAGRYKAKIGMAIGAFYYYPATINDTVAADRALQFHFGWFAHPVYSLKGGFPPIMVTQIASNSIREGRDWSRLPELSENWIEYVRGTADFIGLNYYTSRMAEMDKVPMGRKPSHRRDVAVNEFTLPEWKQAKSSWIYSVPKGLGDMIRFIKDEYNDPEIFVTENGWSDEGQLNDNDRVEYLRVHLKELLKIVATNEARVKGYIAWSLIDNFEWMRGYSEKFGLFSVNFTSENKERTPKQSAYFMKEVIEQRRLPKLNKIDVVDSE